MAFNSALAERVLGYIEANPSKHDQGTWMQVAIAKPSDPFPNGLDIPLTVDSCGTTGCFAGWAVILNEHVTIGDIFWEARYQTTANRYVGAFIQSYDRRGEPYEDISIAQRAQELLGLTHVQMAELFNPQNTVEDLKKMVKHYGDNPGEVWNPDFLEADIDDDNAYAWQTDVEHV